MTAELNSRSDITLDMVRRVAWGGEPVRIAPAALERMAAARARFEQLLDDPELVIYGVTSGYGQNAKRRLSGEERKAHAAQPPTGPCAAAGDALPNRTVRAIVLARLANFLDGHAAITPAVAEAVAAMLDGGPLPQVPARGQGGAGEILSLAPLFHAVAQNVPVAEKDVLSLINGSPAASALSADAALAAERRLALAAEVFALAAEAFNAPLSHYLPELGALWNMPSDQWALAELNRLIGPGHGGARRPYQAPVTFRILPRMLGQARMAYETAADVAARALAAVTDNPVMLAPEAGSSLPRVVSTGGYHNPYAVMAMDALTAASANLVIIAERMSAKLLDGNVSLLPDQLGANGTDAYYGCLPMAITGYEEEARLFAQATLLPGSESGGFGQNDIASPVFLAWKKQQAAGDLLCSALAALTPIALQALAVTGRPVPAALQPLAGAARAAAAATAGTPGHGAMTGALAAAFCQRCVAA